MKCGASIKGKKGATICKGNLSALRTLANGRSVRRERRCTACGRQVWTIEVYESDLEQERQSHKQEVLNLTDRLREAENSVSEIRSSGKHFFSLLEEKGGA
jgi:hypothetical protein